MVCYTERETEICIVLPKGFWTVFLLLHEGKIQRGIYDTGQHLGWSWISEGVCLHRRRRHRPTVLVPGPDGVRIGFLGGGGGRPGLFLTSLCLLAFSPSLVLRPAGPCKLGWHLLRIHTEGVKLFRLLIPAFTVFGSAMNCTKLSLSTHNSASFTLQAPPPYIIMRFNILPAIGGCPTHVPRR